jgi:hypothetical protein
VVSTGHEEGHGFNQAGGDESWGMSLLSYHSRRVVGVLSEGGL